MLLIDSGYFSGLTPPSARATQKPAYLNGSAELWSGFRVSWLAHAEQTGEPMGQPNTDAAQLGGLQGVVLALVVGGRNVPPPTGYRLAISVKRRLGDAWGGSPRSVYKALERLEAEGLVVSQAEGRGRASYRATERGEMSLARWMASAAREPMRLDLPAKIAVSRPEDAPRLLRALDDYERECFERLQASNDAQVPLGSWAGLAMNLARAALDEGLQAELRWVTLARRWIEDYPAHQLRDADADEPPQA